MPTYDYYCSQCGYNFEAFQKINEPPLNNCPQCKKNSLKRLIGGGCGLIFKGSGFYITDYKRKTEDQRQKTEDRKTEKPKNLKTEKPKNS